jgi:nucleotide-binding universal stress UspA family protein
MKNSKQKILVLLDLKKPSVNALKSTVSLAKMIDGDINLFFVKKPTDVVDSENQLSSMRNINDDFKKTKKSIEHLIEPLSKDYGITINYSFTTGNIKDEIGKHIEKHQPDVIVLGKRKAKLFNLLIDNITDFILNKFDGAILVASDQNAITPEKALSLGILGSIVPTSNSSFTNCILYNSQKPLKTFSVVQDTKTTLEEKAAVNNEIVNFTFEKSSNVIKNLSKYLIKSNVNLLYVNKEDKQYNTNQQPNINALIEKLDVSLLIA